MYDKSQSQQIFLNTEFGLKRVYQLLAQENISGISKEDITKTTKLGINDLPFAQILEQDFNKADINNDKVISNDEFNQLLSSLNTSGLSYQQILSLISQSYPGTSGNSTLLETILTHFNEIDVNKDGKVTQNEIDAYNLDKEIEDKKAELYEFKASDISIFNGDSPSETEAEDESDYLNNESVS